MPRLYLLPLPAPGLLYKHPKKTGKGRPTPLCARGARLPLVFPRKREETKAIKARSFFAKVVQAAFHDLEAAARRWAKAEKALQLDRERARGLRPPKGVRRAANPLVHLRDVAFDRAHGIKIVPKEPGQRSPSYTLRLIRRSVARGRAAAEQAAREAATPAPPPIPQQDEEESRGIIFPDFIGESAGTSKADMAVSGRAEQARESSAPALPEPAIPVELASPSQIPCECLVHFFIKQKKVQMLAVLVDTLFEERRRRWYNPFGSESRFLGVSEKVLKKEMKTFLLTGNPEWPVRITKVEFMLQNNLDPESDHVLSLRGSV